MLRWLATAAALLGVVGFAASVGAVPEGRLAVRASFERFAAGWLDKINGAQQQRGTRARFASEQYTTELRPTGRAKAPWVGLLRYVDHTSVCHQSADCSIETSTPVTEIFRYEDGRWVY